MQLLVKILVYGEKVSDNRETQDGEAGDQTKSEGAVLNGKQVNKNVGNGTTKEEKESSVTTKGEGTKGGSDKFRRRKK